MRKNIKNICYICLLTFSLTVFRIPYITKATEIKSNTNEVANKIATEVSAIDKDEVLKMIEKISPYVTYDENKQPKLTTEDLSKLNITKDELKDLKEGMKLGRNLNVEVIEDKATSSSESDLNSTGTVHTDMVVLYNSSYLTVTFSATEVKALLTVALIAGLALTIAGVIYGTETIWLIGSFLIYKGDFLTIVGACLATFASLVTLWWNPTEVTVNIPLLTIANSGGNCSWTGNNFIGVSTTKTAYASAQ